MQMGSDPHVISERVDYYLKTDTPCDLQFLLNVRDLLDKHVTMLDEIYHLHGQLERVKARYIYRAARHIIFCQEQRLTCGECEVFPFLVDYRVVFKCYNKCKCATEDIPQDVIDYAKKEMEGDGLEWF